MRFALVILGILALSSIGRADFDNSIEDQKEEGLEADSTAMEIHDLESEQKIAREQARAQEQMKRDSDKRLQNLRAQKASITDRIKLDISLAEARRKKAEAETAANQKQIKALEAGIRNLQLNREKAEKAAEQARAISAAGRETIKNLRQKRAEEEMKTRRAYEDNRRAQAELAQLRAESRRLQTASANH